MQSDGDGQLGDGQREAWTLQGTWVLQVASYGPRAFCSDSCLASMALRTEGVLQGMGSVRPSVGRRVPGAGMGSLFLGWAVGNLLPSGIHGWASSFPRGKG